MHELDKYKACSEVKVEGRYLCANAILNVKELIVQNPSRNQLRLAFDD